MVQLALDSAEILRHEGIQLHVVNARFIKPLDETMLIELADKGMQILTLEEGAVLGGFGSAVLEFYAAQNKHNVTVKPIGIPDYFVEHGSVKEQRIETGLTVEKIVEEIRGLHGKR
jgi:1-deoxy-D-xylulose-5-phosphate synthase